jgi:Ca2+-transporting ATPase
MQGYNEAITRTMVFTTLISANIFLTFVNRSFVYSVFTTIKYKNKLIVLVTGITVAIAVLLLFVKPVNQFFQFKILDVSLILLSVGMGLVSVIWYELVKWNKRISLNKKG